MNDASANQFDAGAYWQSRVGSDADLAVVGHRSMGPAYNAEIYARRIEALEDMLDRNRVARLDELELLDVGCGSGFYTEYWRASGVTNYTGIDISRATIERLALEYPGYRFEIADITASPEVGTFDIVTVFDVLYHVVEAQRFDAALATIAATVKTGGLLIVMDQLNDGEYQLSRHVVFRDRKTYLDGFRRQGLELVDDELLFHYLVPPMIGIRVAAWLAAAAFKLTGLIVRNSDSLARRLARRMRRRDTRLRAGGKRVANSELLAFRKAAPGTAA